MQQIESDAPAARAETPRGLVSPPVAFALLLGVVAAIGLTIFLLRPDSSGSPNPAPPITNSEPSFELANAEAIARFQELNQLRIQAYSDRDASLLGSIYTSDSRVRKRVAREISQLIQDRVIDASREMSLDVDILENTEEEIRLQEVAKVVPKFRSENGRAVTSNPAPVREIRVWILHFENGHWLVFDALIREAKRQA